MNMSILIALYTTFDQQLTQLVQSQIHNNKSWCKHAATCLTEAWCSATWMAQAIVDGHAQYLTYSQPHATLIQ